MKSVRLPRCILAVIAAGIATTLWFGIQHSVWLPLKVPSASHSKHWPLSNDEPRPISMIATSLNLNEPMYAFYLPIVAMFYSRLEIDVLAVLVGPGWDSPLGDHISSSFSAASNLNSVRMPLAPDADNFARPISQVVRLFAPFLLAQKPGESTEDGPFMFTSDVDILLLKSEYFVLSRYDTEQVSLFNDLGRKMTPFYGESCPMIAMHSMGMSMRLWREMSLEQIRKLKKDAHLVGGFEVLATNITRTADSSDVSELVAKLLTDGFNYEANSAVGVDTKLWYMDQVLGGCIASRVRERHIPIRAYKPVDMAGVRIDRISWPSSTDMPVSVERSIDSHALRPGYSTTNWPKMMDLLREVFNETEVQSVQEYKKTFCILTKCA